MTGSTENRKVKITTFNLLEDKKQYSGEVLLLAEKIAIGTTFDGYAKNSIMEYGEICEHDTGYLCEHRLKWICDYVENILY